MPMSTAGACKVDGGVVGFRLAAVKDLSNLAGTWISITAMLVVVQNPAAGMALPSRLSDLGSPCVCGRIE